MDYKIWVLLDRVGILLQVAGLNSMWLCKLINPFGRCRVDIAVDLVIGTH